MLNEQAIDHVRATFTAGKPPKNVRASNYFGQHRILRRFTRFALGSRLFSAAGSFSYRLNGEQKRIEFNGRNLQFHAIYDLQYRNGYEIETALLLAHLCCDNEAFWDIGANWGYFSLLAASLPDFFGKIEAFEPNPRTFNDLVSTVNQAGLTARIHNHNLGAGSRCCEMVVAETDQFTSGLSKLATNGSGAKIPVTTLDEFKAPQPGFIKIDAEGMELDILKGATRLMREAKPFLAFENFADYLAPTETLLPIEFLQANGYEVFIPVLHFNIHHANLLATYGSDYNSLFESDARPRLHLVQLNPEKRFLYAHQLNLLGVHVSRLADLRARGLPVLSAA